MREFEIRTIVYDKYDRPKMLVCMDLETYNEALTCYIQHLQDDCFNQGFELGKTDYQEEEIVNVKMVDDHRTEEEY